MSRKIQLLYLALALSVLATTILVILLLRAQSVDTDFAGALDTAERFALHLTTFSPTTFERDVEEVKSLATPRFGRSYQKSVGDPAAFEQHLRERGATSKGEIVASGVELLQKDRAQAIVMVLQTVTNESTDIPQSSRRELRLLLVRTRGSWRVDEVKTF